MSFLAPLYAIAALAVLAPILFHLVRKRPKEVTEFSSVIFLDAVPPKFSNRSRLEHLGLLALRIAAFGLLAFAFARPYWNSTSDRNAEPKTRKERLLVIDTSASMRRVGVWEQAVEKAMRVIDEANADDIVAVYSMQETLEPVLSLETARELPLAQRRAAAMKAVQELTPTWCSSNVGVVLSQAADLFGQDGAVEQQGSSDVEDNGGSAGVLRTIYLVSDLPRDGTLESFQVGVWPGGVQLVPLVCAAAQPGNASAIILPVDALSDEGGELLGQMDGEVRVMLSNSVLSRSERLQLQWLRRSGVPVAETQQEYFIPPGQQQVVRFPLPKGVSARESGSVGPAGASEDVGTNAAAWVLELSGDEQVFDNRRFYCVERAQDLWVGMIDRVPEIPENSLWYFAKRVPLSRVFESVKWKLFEPADGIDEVRAKEARWWVASHAMTVAQAKALTSSLVEGGHLFWVWDRPADSTVAPSELHQNQLEILKEWFSEDKSQRERVVGEASARGNVAIGSIRESAGSGYALLENLQLTHPVLFSFADSKFNDFSKIRFWNHRVFEPSILEDWNIIGRFDDGSPALLERSLGKGKVTILTSGWQTSESQFALSSKFVPILSGLFDQAYPLPKIEERLVGVELGASMVVGKLETPSGEAVSVDAASRVRYREPGFYEWYSGAQAISVDSDEKVERSGVVPQHVFSVNLDKRETRTDPMELEEFSRVGVVLDLTNAKEKAIAQNAVSHRLAEELESRQQGWWWTIVAVLVLATIESLWGLVRSAGNVAGSVSNRRAA